jgi:hypothetical protein
MGRLVAMNLRAGRLLMMSAVVGFVVASCTATTTDQSTASSPAAGLTGSQASVRPSPAAGSVWVSGTHVAIVPPDGFDTATSFVGFAHEPSGSSLLITELPASFQELAVTMLSEEAWATQGIEVDEFDELSVGGLPAVFIRGTQTTVAGEVGKLILVMGTERRSALLTGNYPTGDTEIADALYASLLTAILDPERVVDEEAALTFAIDPVPPLQFAGTFNNGAGYNTSGTLPSADPLEPTLIVAPSLGSAAIADPEAFSRQRFEQTATLVDPIVEETRPIEIAGLSGIELIGRAEHEGDGVALVIYQVLLVGDDSYVIMSGRARAQDGAVWIQRFRESARTYRPR